MSKSLIPVANLWLLSTGRVGGGDGCEDGDDGSSGSNIGCKALFSSLWARRFSFHITRNGSRDPTFRKYWKIGNRKHRLSLLLGF